MHQAGLDGGVRERGFDGLGEAGEPVGADEQDVSHAAGLQVGADVQPGVRALGLLKPQAEHVALALESDADRDVAR